ncbi:ABC transporter ATP-binding protein [uncultured Enterovirga sp.]|uniref:ABC transporter ATP-binding protein n=1 Tax=uncultured Enterovirga sp. TaxID=2026352 RepID=UPI0035CC9DBA
MASISLQNVSLSYPIYEGSSRSLKNSVLRTVGGQLSRTSGRIDVHALQDVSLDLADGDRLALVGRNGAGKSTLLKVLGGIYEPPAGRVVIEGRVSSLTDVNMGMDMDATGRDNIVARCIFLGMTFAEARGKLAEIEEFTELGAFLDMPARTYSAGMQVRLGFAASTASRPDILIMDEMVGAGDAAFAERAQQRITQFVERASILVFASHNNDILAQFCNRAVLLESGRIVLSGSVEAVVGAYHDGIS